MISKQEIFDVSDQLNLPIVTVEKDYILGWLLAGIYQHAELKNVLVFKGGTCLKKCFFKNYRFSEDLDFTLIDPKWLSERKIMHALEEIAGWIFQQSEIQLPIKYLQCELYTNPRGHLAIKGGAKYRGPLAQKTNFPRIKIDISGQELLVTSPIKKSIMHDYSDGLNGKKEAVTYSFEEIFAEKIRALVQRARPRDLYDVIHLRQQRIYKTDRAQLTNILRKKCDFAKAPYPTMGNIKSEARQVTLNDAWNAMLGHQIASLKPVEYYWEQLEEVLGWLSG